MLHKTLRGCIVLLLAALVTEVAVVTGRHSPHGEYIQELVMNQQGSSSRFSNNVLEDALLDVPGLIAKYGYPYEVHNMITSDGYILEAHRIPHGRDNNNTPDPNKPIVFLMHGLLSSSADFLVLGPGKALGYLLAEAGYDVWLGNARGNYYSRRHICLNPDSHFGQKFWKFSWDEIGNIDVAKFVDFILERTGQTKLHYIGHSQGGTSFLVLNSLKPEYNEKFISFQGLAPAAYFINNKNIIFKVLAPLGRVIETSAFAMGVGEIFGGTESITWFATIFCHDDIFSTACSRGFARFAKMEYLNGTMVPIILGHAPAGASIRQVAHYGQTIRFKKFRRFNYSFLKNLIIYNRISPPEYDLSKITVPTYLHYGLNDDAVHYKDIYVLANKLSNTIGTYQVERPTFSHFDFVWSMDAKESVYDRLIDCMKDAERLNP